MHLEYVLCLWPYGFSIRIDECAAKFSLLLCRSNQTLTLALKHIRYVRLSRCLRYITLFMDWTWVICWRSEWSGWRTLYVDTLACTQTLTNTSPLSIYILNRRVSTMVRASTIPFRRLPTNTDRHRNINFYMFLVSVHPPIFYIIVILDLRLEWVSRSNTYRLGAY